MAADDVAFLTVSELAQRIRTRRLSPVELTRLYLDRSRNLGPRFNAYVTLTEPLALAQAERAEREIRAGHYRGPLHGIPYAAKDLVAVPGYPTTWGAKPYAQRVLNQTAAVIERLEHAGAILIGKAAMIELAGGLGYRTPQASFTGAARNPWNLDRWTCGSSSGSGAVVAAALAAFALGSETNGSILCPSSSCGISGLRPTFGRVSRYGAMALAYSMDKLGPMARSAEDLALILEALAGHDPRDRSMLPVDRAAFTFSPAADLKSRALRVGWLTNAWKSYDADIPKILDAAKSTLRHHFPSVHDTPLPEGPWEDAANLILSAEVSSAFHSLIRSGRVKELTDPMGKIAGYVSQSISGADYNRALRIRDILQRKMSAIFEAYDVLVAASQPVTATPLNLNLFTGLSFADPLGAIGNLCGLPALSVPCGFTEKHLPVGLQFVARAGDDAAVLQAGRIFQQATAWHHKHPKL